MLLMMYVFVCILLESAIMLYGLERAKEMFNGLTSQTGLSV